MLILFPKKNGVKLAISIIFHEIEQKSGFSFVFGMLYFASKFGAITQEETNSLVMYLNEAHKEDVPPNAPIRKDKLRDLAKKAFNLGLITAEEKAQYMN